MKKLYMLIMVLLLSLMAAVPVFAENNSRLTGNETDVAASGEYEGYRRILNHKLAGEYELYFIVRSANSYQISTQYIGNHDMNEVLRFTLNGTGYAATRAQWYAALRACDPNNEGRISQIVGEQFYKEFFAYEYGQHEAGRITEEYIQKVILKIEPVDRFAGTK